MLSFLAPLMFNIDSMALKKNNKTCFNFFFAFLLPPIGLPDLDTGKALFISNCNICHIQGKNLIIAEKDLKKDTLETYGLSTKEAISYQILNGKNGMPAFGGRLQEDQIDAIAQYVLKATTTNDF